jgi:hypothetical protein
LAAFVVTVNAWADVVATPATSVPNGIEVDAVLPVVVVPFTDDPAGKPATVNVNTVSTAAVTSTSLRMTTRVQPESVAPTGLKAISYDPSDAGFVI